MERIPRAIYTKELREEAVKLITEGVKKLAHCGSAHRVGRLVQALEGGSLDVWVTFVFSKIAV
ncbi:MAG: hypothetical protein Q8N70_01785 [Deltaproteobacteria bacterium]|nr:hypothetical protein [Deltaproteobacteria bacterium]